jgi:hypothetical protein
MTTEDINRKLGTEGTGMATAPVKILETAREKLERLRHAARKRTNESWGDEEKLREEALKVHDAFADARNRANQVR